MDVLSSARPPSSVRFSAIQKLLPDLNLPSLTWSHLSLSTAILSFQFVVVFSSVDSCTVSSLWRGQLSDQYLQWNCALSSPHFVLGFNTWGWVFCKSVGIMSGSFYCPHSLSLVFWPCFKLISFLWFRLRIGITSKSHIRPPLLLFVSSSYGSQNQKKH